MDAVYRYETAFGLTILVWSKAYL